MNWFLVFFEVLLADGAGCCTLGNVRRSWQLTVDLLLSVFCTSTSLCNVMSNIGHYCTVNMNSEASIHFSQNVTVERWVFGLHIYEVTDFIFIPVASWVFMTFLSPSKQMLGLLPSNRCLYIFHTRIFPNFSVTTVMWPLDKHDNCCRHCTLLWVL